MDHLWTPWRFQYISTGLPEDECIFCHFRDSDPAEDQDNLVLSRRRYNYIILNRFPYTSGHLMVVVNSHVASLAESGREELGELIVIAQECEKALHEVYRPDGFNLGFNLGKCAGAGVAGHLHLHVLPRWIGDSNVVSVVGQTRIIPEELDSSFEKLVPLLQKR